MHISSKDIFCLYMLFMYVPEKIFYGIKEKIVFNLNVLGYPLRIS